jgi:hypothetical protein
MTCKGPHARRLDTAKLNGLAVGERKLACGMRGMRRRTDQIKARRHRDIRALEEHLAHAHADIQKIARADLE